MASSSSTTAAPAASTTTQLPPTSINASPNLVPIRVDATWGDIRVVDTLLFDPSSWPIPLFHPLEEAVEENVQELAHSILMDAEVYGMGRTVRHFTGRTDVWSRGFQQKIACIIRPQLWALVNNPAARKKKEMVKIHLRLSIHGVNINDDFQWDPNVPDQCPIAFARQLVEDLKLSEEFVPPIATAIVEQLGGIQVEGSAKPTSAFNVDPREQVANVAHITSFHRPSR